MGEGTIAIFAVLVLSIKAQAHGSHPLLRLGPLYRL
jgi:hypothetical protein